MTGCGEAETGSGHLITIATKILHRKNESGIADSGSTMKRLLMESRLVFKVKAKLCLCICDNHIADSSRT